MLFVIIPPNISSSLINEPSLSTLQSDRFSRFHLQRRFNFLKYSAVPLGVFNPWSEFQDILIKLFNLGFYQLSQLGESLSDKVLIYQLKVMQIIGYIVLKQILSAYEQSQEPHVAESKHLIQSTIICCFGILLWFPAEYSEILWQSLIIDNHSTSYSTKNGKSIQPNNITEPRKSRGGYIFCSLERFRHTLFTYLFSRSQVNQTSFESPFFRY